VDIAAWLRELGFERYADRLRANEIDLDVLPDLTEDDLEKLGIPLGHRKKLLRAIVRLAAAAGHGPDAAVSPSVSEAARGEAERRQLSVLFCDLVGSTELAARLDPEDMGRLIRAYQDCCAAVVERWGGHVAKYMGDGVLAYFGWPRAHEDEAERAVRAGLALAEAVGWLASPSGAPLAARVGIATGLVMVGERVGEGAAKEQTVVGETPNLAARLQALAAPGSVVISQATRRLVGGLFELAELGPLRLKGFAEPLAAWRVAGEGRAEDRFEALHGAHLTPLVGREHELGILLERWAWAKDGDGQVVLLGGEPGIGKSRLVRALRARLGDEPYTSISHYCSPHHTNSALYPVIGLLERAARLDRGATPAAQLTRLEALLARSSARLDEVVPLLAALLGVPTGARYPALTLAPEVQKRQTFQVLVEQLAGLAAQQPVLALYEDAHWIDPSTLELLGLVIERIRRLRVLALITFRPEFQPPWSGQAHVTTLTMSRLGRRQGADLVARVTGEKPLPAEIVAQIVARTDGVPLFVEELTKTVLESGLLADAGDRFELSGPLPPLAIPTTLHDSLMARLDRLAPIKEVAQTGAVIGREFSHELLAAVSPLSAAELGAAVDQLVDAELVFRRGVAPDATYSFKHALVQDAAYQSLLKSRRQQLHAQIAKVLEEQFPEVTHGQPEVLAHHHAQAGAVPQAIACWARAGRRAAEGSADREAFAHLSQGLELVGQIMDPRARAARELELRIALGSVLMNLKGAAAPEVGELYQRAWELCREVGRAEQAFPVLWGLWFHHYTSGRLGLAVDLADRAIGVAVDLPETVFRLQAEHAAWTTRAAFGEFALAYRHVEAGLGVYDPERHASSAFVYAGHDAGVCAHTAGALLSWLLGHPDRALRLAREGVALAERLDHPLTPAQALCHEAIVHQLRGEPGPVAEDADRLLACCATHDLSIWARNGEILKGWTLLATGETEEGLRQFRSALDARRAARAIPRQGYYLAVLAEALGAAGRPQEGLEAATEALAYCSEDRRWEALAHRVRGDLLRAGPERDEAAAEAALRRALEAARRQEAKAIELRAATSLARLLADRGEARRARDLLAPVYGWFAEGFETADLKAAKALLGELGWPARQRPRPRGISS
jgi:class 3 adenylate cyclase/predicted ATPase